MSCCGSRRAVAAKARGEAAPLEFEYVGRSALTVLGPSTGFRYRFDHPGARLPVEARDAFALQSVPLLRRRMMGSDTVYKQKGPSINSRSQ